MSDTEDTSIEAAAPAAAPAPELDSAPEGASASEKRVYLFNRFYFDLLKKVKNQAKKQKATNRDARNILRAIKASYASYATGSAEYIDALTSSIPSSFWEAYYACGEDTIDAFLSTEEASAAWAYREISVGMLASCVKDKFLLHHYLTIFAIFLQKDAANEDVERAMELLKNLKTNDIAAEIEPIANMDVKKWIVKLHAVYTHQITHVFQSQFSDMESTSIGKLAKEIMEEVDMSAIQNTVSGDGDIFKALSDPNSGIASLLGTVSQKMIGKLASGEIKQENLLEDAMKFATKLPGMIQGSGASGSGLGSELGKMASTVQSMLGGLSQAGGNGNDGADAAANPFGALGALGGALGGLDIGSLTQMMQGMMGGSGGAGGGAAGRRAVSASSAARRMADDARRGAMVQRMRNRMEKAKSKENVTEK